MAPLGTANIILRKPNNPGDFRKFEHKWSDNANERTCMFDANIFITILCLADIKQNY